MNFFIISQDNRVTNYVEPTGVSKVIDSGSIIRGNADGLDDMPVQVYIKEKSENEYIDLIDKPVPLISEKLKQVLEVYQKNTFFKPVVLADAKRMKQDLYWLIVPKGIECVSSKSEFFKDGALRRLVIDEKKINSYKVFKVAGILENIVIINQDVAESILRRDFYGITLKKVDKE